MGEFFQFSKDYYKQKWVIALIFSTSAIAF